MGSLGVVLGNTAVGKQTIQFQHSCTKVFLGGYEDVLLNYKKMHFVDGWQ